MAMVIDIQLALEQAGGNEELAKELLLMLLKELPLLNEALRQAITAQDGSAMWDHTHKLYGSTAYCGVPGLRQSAKSLEDAVKHSQHALIVTAHAQVCSEIAVLLAEGPACLARRWR
jgi:two-component system, NarL family, sensor histidine kinase BarA